MRWWMRLVLTLVLAPLLWQLGLTYIASQQGAEWSDLAAQSAAVLASVYIAFTLPALVLCGVLGCMDWALTRLGLGLLTLVLSPMLAWLIATTLIALAQSRGLQGLNGASILAVFYGLVWGLTIREPRGRHPADVPPRLTPA